MNKFLSHIKYAFFQLPKIEIINDETISICGCKGINQYENGCIGVKMNGYSVQIIGTNLKLSEYTFSNIEVTGKIKNIEFLRIT